MDFISKLEPYAECCQKMQGKECVTMPRGSKSNRLRDAQYAKCVPVEKAYSEVKVLCWGKLKVWPGRLKQGFIDVKASSGSGHITTIGLFLIKLLLCSDKLFSSLSDNYPFANFKMF